jgi:ribonuclease VapC
LQHQIAAASTRARSLAALARVAWRRFGKSRHPAALNYGDCFGYALAKSRRLPLLFSGEDFARTDVEPAVLP